MRSANSKSPNGRRTSIAKQRGDGPVEERLESYDQLGTDLGIRAKPAAVITGPDGTRTLQDGPSLAEFERAIEAVGGLIAPAHRTSSGGVVNRGARI